MNIRRFWISGVAAGAALWIATGAAVAGDGTVEPQGNAHAHTHTPEPTVAVAPIPVGGTVSVVMGVNGFAGGNVAVSAGPDGLLVVDDLLPGFAGRLEDALAQVKTCMDCGDLKYLINTHWHFDHVGNNDYFGGAAVLIAHETVRPLLAAPQEIKFLGMKFDPKTPQGLPDITFAQRASLVFNGEEVELTHFPQSHTTGDVAVYFTQSNVLHTGDLFFNRMFPFIDFEHGGSAKGMIRSVEQILERYPHDVQIIPGHGELTDMQGLRAYLEMLKDTVGTVEAAKRDGKTLEEVQRAGLDDKWKSWQWPLMTTEGWIAMVYQSL